MWVLTKTEWPTLVNLSVVASIGYQQPIKYDPRMRVIAATWEQEHLLAECETGDQAKALVRQIALALRQGTTFLDLSRIDPSRLEQSAESGADGVI